VRIHGKRVSGKYFDPRGNKEKIRAYRKKLKHIASFVIYAIHYPKIVKDDATAGNASSMIEMLNFSRKT
jgi:hypothetical protein